ncbi:hypothetical protein N3K66_001074 [Trichothecium roseum]|uniref:Uncharacterized protein n=1 Tax=Trichothecium roseum TaxID=47278 RepID=A0ACC0VFD6_9HYPO|nr:hypothetical protein N3K66_001074 [Trichothecium roseum]
MKVTTLGLLLQRSTFESDRYRSPEPDIAFPEIFSVHSQRSFQERVLLIEHAKQPIEPCHETRAYRRSRRRTMIAILVVLPQSTMKAREMK